MNFAISINRIIEDKLRIIERKLEEIRSWKINSFENGRRKYKAEYIRYLIFAQASCDETISHLDTINVLYPDIREFDGLDKSYDTLGKKINKYLKYVENNWRT